MKERKFTQQEYLEMIREARIPEKLLDENGLPLPRYDCIYDSFDIGLERFLQAQNFLGTYQTALAEVKAGRKTTHWIWFIFPQMIGLGSSRNATFYGIKGRKEAQEYINHPVLRQRLIEITEAVLVNEKSAYEIFGPDGIKFRSSMLLFASVSEEDVFKQVINKYRW